jgi:hypothetical protein
LAAGSWGEREQKEKVTTKEDAEKASELLPPTESKEEAEEEEEDELWGRNSPLPDPETFAPDVVMQQNNLQLSRFIAFIYQMVCDIPDEQSLLPTAGPNASPVDENVM